MARGDIPRYFLYGEFGDLAADRFLHVETIASRSGAHDWTIRPHAHAMLGHLLFVATGGGEMLVEGARLPFGRAILTVPVGAVHGFRFAPGTDGHVVTIADPLLRRLAGRHPALAGLHRAARVLPLVEGHMPGALLDALVDEMADPAPLAGVAGEALLQLLLAHAARLLPDAAIAIAPPRPAAALVARLRAQIDAHLRDGWTVADHVRALATSASRLRACCIEVTGQPPIRILHDHLIGEARRQLAYTDRGVAAIGYDLGFDDPAYFSRFFRRAAGAPPAAWRAAQAAVNAPASPKGG